MKKTTHRIIQFPQNNLYDHKIRKQEIGSQQTNMYRYSLPLVSFFLKEKFVVLHTFSHNASKAYAFKV